MDECSCGCQGDWSDCENNKENYLRDYSYSRASSHQRDNDDWFICEKNPLYEEPVCDIILKGSTKKFRIKYLEECIKRYYTA